MRGARARGCEPICPCACSSGGLARGCPLRTSRDSEEWQGRERESDKGVAKRFHVGTSEGLLVRLFSVRNRFCQKPGLPTASVSRRPKWCTVRAATGSSVSVVLDLLSIGCATSPLVWRTSPLVRWDIPMWGGGSGGGGKSFITPSRVSQQHTRAFHGLHPASPEPKPGQVIIF